MFVRQENYAAALSDTKLAIKCGYPKHLKYKVYQRQAKCLSELSDFTQGLSCLYEWCEGFSDKWINCSYGFS